jgi:hypothetical protein
VLLEAQHPGCLPTPFTQSVALEFEVAGVFRHEKKYAEADESSRSQRGRERSEILAAVPLFIEIHRAFFRPLDECQLGEIFVAHRSRISIGIDFLMLDVFGRDEPLEIRQLRHGA